jgi:tRNA threonylcarbamoyladenosine biosynthesis protein TsaE
VTEPDVHRLVDATGTSGSLALRPPWSVEVRDVDGPDLAGWLLEAERWAAARGALDLRAGVPLPGARRLEPGGTERVRPVPVALPDATATRALGRRVAAVVRPGDLLVLSGPLGAGKTTFAQGLGEGLGVRGRVTSPTFVLARVHRGPVPLVHVDAYRLRPTGADAALFDLDDLDLEAALEDAVTVVEWGEGVVEGLADARLEVRLSRPAAAAPDGGGVEGRTGRVTAVGARWAVLPAGAGDTRAQGGDVGPGSGCAL